MKKIYNNVIGIALSTLVCLGMALSAHAQRGGEHSDGGSTPPPPPPPAAQVSRPAPPPQPQQQPQQMQRSDPQPQQQQQQPQMQRSNPQPQQQTNTFGGQRGTNAVGVNTSSPRGIEHRESPVFRPDNPDNGQRHYPGVGQRGYTYNQREYGNSYPDGYRSYPGLPYGENHITVRPGGFYYHNRGYYGTYYRPQLGFSLDVLPYGYYPFYFGPSQYFYSDGLYYRLEDNNYTVVEPPIGAIITRLPARAQAIAINGMQYYELNGIYYQPITRDDGKLVYQIAGKDGELNIDDTGNSQDDLPQVGDLVDNLPAGSKAIRLNGQKYYVSREGYYFQRTIDTNGDKVYVIVGIPSDN